MTFEGRARPPKKGERYWQVYIPDLGIFTAGKSEKDAYMMAADALETVVDQKGFRAHVAQVGGGRFFIFGSDPTPLVARWLCHLRLKRGVSVRQAAAQLGSQSPESWARYESGRASPSIEKLSQLLAVVDPEARFAFQRREISGKKVR